MKDVFAKLSELRRQQPVLFWLRVAVIVAVVVLFIFKRSFWTPDTLFLVLLALFAVLGKAKDFLLRFLPFLLLFLAYESFRGIADDLNRNVHYFEMINFDKTLFGGVLPTAWLQKMWWHGYVQWYDFYFYFLYTIHFLVPILLAVLFWLVRPKLYWPFVTALLILSFGAFFTYVIFPAAPPWIATNMHFIEPIHRVSSDIWAAMGVTNFSGLYAKMSPNLVAAVSSLHSAYPMLFVLFIAKAFSGRRMWWLMFYPISMWIGVVYLGEHYVMDVILGATYALAAYFITLKLFAYAEQHHWNLKELSQNGYRRVRNGVGRIVRKARKSS